MALTPMTRSTLMTAGQCRAHGSSGQSYCDTRARHWSAISRIQQLGLDQCHARYTDPACVALTPMTLFTLMTAGQCRARGCNTIILAPRARHWSATGRIQQLGLDQCHARYPFTASVAACKTFCIRITLVIGPTPPGTGVSIPATAATSVW